MSHRKKLRFWNGVRFRITAGLLLLLTLGSALLYLAVMSLLGRNMEAQVVSDLQRLRSSTEVYVRQILILNEQNNDSEGFFNCAREIAEELYGASLHRTALFSTDGQPLLDCGYPENTDRSALYASLRELNSFSNAQNGSAAYDLRVSANSTYEVWFTMPLDIAGRRTGIVCYYLDYSGVYRQYLDIVRMVLNTTMLTLLVVTLLILLFLTGILKPITSLSRVSSRVANDIRRGRVSTGSLVSKKLTRRKDELGQLSRDYALMLRTVEKQFSRIQEDRDNILKLLRSRQEFYNNVTHELKTPLTTIRGYAQLLEEDNMHDPELFRTALEHIEHESGRLHQMVIQLLEMSNREIHTHMEPVDLSAVVSSVAASMELKARRYSCSIRADVPGGVRILGNEERIRQLCINLLDNAIKYGEAGQPIRAELTAGEDQAVLRVINRGEGISPEALPHIFESFYRADKERSRELGSAGLGLAICQKIVEEHKGSITAESVPGGETVFTVRIPLPDEDEADGAEE